MKDSITIFALDLSYLKTGFAVIRQPGDQVLKYGVVVAEPQNPKKVTDAARIQRARSAFDGLRLALYHADQDFGPLDALVYEEAAWIGAAMRRKETSKAAIMGLGMALQTMYLTLSLVGWARADPETAKFTARPMYSIDPARWQPLFTGVSSRQLQPHQMKALVRRTVALRCGIELGPKEHDAADAIAIGLTFCDLWRAGTFEES